MKMIKWLSLTALVVLGAMQNARAAYLLAMDEDSQDFTLTVFDTESGEIVQSYATSLPEETENVVYASDNVAYGIQSDSSSSSLYQFILSDDGSVSSLLVGSGDIGQVDAITLAGDTLYAVSSDSDSLYSVDTETGEFTELFELNYTWVNGGGKIKDNKSLKDVEGLTYYDGVLYGVDSQLDQLFAIDLESESVTLIGSTVNGIESLAFGDDGTLYAAAADTLYTIDVNTGSTLSSLDLGSWATDIEGLSLFSSSATSVPELGSALAWLLIIGGSGYLVRRRRAAQ